MTTQDVMQQLESLGTEQTRKTYRRHGADEPIFGVRYADLYALQKKIKVNHEMARELWATGNHDARVLALLIADPAAATDADLETWAGDLTNHVLAAPLGEVVSRSPLAQEKAVQWMDSDEEWRGSAGWVALGGLASINRDMPDSFFAAYLPCIENRIHTAKNQVRYAMNSALIAIGLYREGLREQALEVAARIGKVDVDHGDTSCKTPDAAKYILTSVEKLASRKRAA